MSAVQIGQAVTGGVPHIVTNNTTDCPVASAKPLINNLPATDFEAADICYWCRRQDNLTAAHVENTTGAFNRALDNLLTSIKPIRTRKQQAAVAAENAAAQARMEAQHAAYYADETPVAAEPVDPEVARRLALVARYRATEPVTVEAPVEAVDELPAPASFAALRTRYAATHPKTTGRVAHVNLAA